MKIKLSIKSLLTRKSSITRLDKKSISIKLVNTLTISFLIIMSLNGIISFFLEKQKEENNFNKIANHITKRLENSLVTPVWEYSLNQISTVIDLEMGDENVLAIIFKEKWDSYTIGKIKNEKWQIVDFKDNKNSKERLKASYIHKSRNLFKGNEKLGSLDLYITDYYLNKNLRNSILFTVFQFIILILFSGIVLFFRLNKIVLHPISTLNNVVEKMTSRDFTEASLRNSFNDDETDSFYKILQNEDEIGILSNNFVVMNDTINNKIEELKMMDKLKDEFLANTSHELRTPLNGIIGLVDSLLDGSQGKLTKSIKYNLSLIIASGKRLFGLVNDILDFSKLRNEDIELQLKSIDVKIVVDLVLLLLKPLITDKDIKLINKIKDDIPTVIADENRLQQIIYNLAGNGIKFTDKGSVEVSAKIKGNFIEISVTDTGIGIPEDKFDAIFKSFEQADGSTARIYGGTGLGLTITKDLIELHKGEISMVSTIGKGSTFSFTLPVSGDESEVSILDNDISKISFSYKSEDSESLIDQEDEQQIARTNNNDCILKILIVDDEPVNRQVLNNILSMNNYDLEMASSGSEALEIINTKIVPDIILLDVMMPKMSGFEVCSFIRNDYSSTELPIILLTAKNQIEDLIQGFDSGANDYIAKPFSKQELLSRLSTQKKILKQHRELQDKSRLEKEMEIAEKIQTAILPDLPEHNDMKIEALMKPAEEVGGDYYDVMFDKNDNIWFAIGDVSGHGVTPGLIMMMAQSCFSGIIKNEDLSPKDALNRVNFLLNDNIRERLKEYYYMTMQFLKYMGNGRFIGSGAGHPDVIIYRDDIKKCEEVDLGGFFLGMQPDLSPMLEEKEIVLKQNDIILLYTDGISESRHRDSSDNLNFFDFEKISIVLIENADEPLSKIRDQIFNGAMNWCKHKMTDDMTMVLIRMN